MEEPSYSIDIESDGIVIIVQRGFWTPELATRFVTAASATIAEMQAKGSLRLVIDGRRLAVPSAKVSAYLAEFDTRARREGDRVAMVVESSLLKMQLKRQIARPGLQIFISIDAARTWAAA